MVQWLLGCCDGVQIIEERFGRHSGGYPFIFSTLRFMEDLPAISKHTSYKSFLSAVNELPYNLVRLRTPTALGCCPYHGFLLIHDLLERSWIL